MTLLLALDSACASCSAAIWDDDQILSQKFEAMSRGQSENLMPIVSQVIKESNKSISDIEALSVTLGPGAFTGIRICLSAARGLALALKKPLIGVSTMEALLAGQDLTRFTGSLVAVIIETKRQDLYVQLFNVKGMALSKPEALLPLDILKKCQDLNNGGPVYLCGDGADRFGQTCEEANLEIIWGSGNSQPNAGVFGRVALEKLKHEGVEAFMVSPAPLYLRPPDAIPPKPKFLFRPAGSTTIKSPDNT